MTPKDISRFLHKPRKHYAGVRLQQGRLLLDSDFNEGARFAAEERRELLLDLIGPKGSPDQGFSIGEPLSSPELPQTPALSPGEPLPALDYELGAELVRARNPSIRAGSFYLGGQRLTLEAPEPFLFQRDFLQLRRENLPLIDEPLDEPIGPPVFRDLYYLHSFDQCVTAVEDPEILEPALGGQDTSVRVRRMRRVEVAGNFGPRQASCLAAWNGFVGRLQGSTAAYDRETGELRSRARLQIVLREEIETSDCRACNPDRGSRFLGVDNQTIRIQLGERGFVWALDNATPLYKVRVFDLDSDSPIEVTVQMLTPPADERNWPLTGRVVEIIPFGALLQGGGELPPSSPEQPDPHFKKVAAETGVFTRVLSSYDPDTRSFTIDPDVGLEQLKKLVYSWDPEHPNAAELTGSSPGERYFYLRMWHEAPSAEDVELPLNRDEGGPTLAGTNIAPVFSGNGRPGDYWVVAVRPGLPEGVVPFDLTRDGGVPPHGPRHFYAPLALVHGTDDVTTNVADCRPQIRRLSDKGCVTFTVGDGVNSFGDFTSIQAAIEAVPNGGRVAIRAGLYRERIFIQGRRDIVIEGCGAATVIESPLPLSPRPPLLPLASVIDIDNSTGVTVTGLVVHAVEHHAVVVRNGCDNVELTNLGANAGVRSGTRFAPGTNGSALPLILVQNGTNVLLKNLILEPFVRPSLSLLATDFVQASKITAVGASSSEFPPAPVMIQVTSCSEVEVRDSILSAFGQVGVEIGASSNVRVRAVSVVAGRNVATFGNRVTPTQSALSVNGASQVTLEENSVLIEATPSEHAGIVVLGTDLSLRENRVEALAGCFDSPSPRQLRSPSSPDTRCLSPFPHAWGGIQVRGSSARVELRGNQILGGVGHGITLGSILWQHRGLVAQRVGAGRGQMQALADGTRVVSGLIPPSFPDERRRFFAASDEGSIRDLLIIDNRIEQMLTNGISVISVLGVPNGDLIDIDRARIERNTIAGNLLRPSQTVGLRSDALPGDPLPGGSGTLIPVLPFGGIVLGTITSGAEIRDNLISGNGTSSTLPINGIFVLNGEAVTIAENRIIGNGGRALPDLELRPGVRSGIAVMLAGSGTIDSQADINRLLISPRQASFLESLGFDNNGASLRVLNNTVVHPEGRALHVLATGPVAVDGNSFASLGNHGANIAQDQLGAGDVVLVQNFGPPWEDFPRTRSAFSGPFTPDYRVPHSEVFVRRYFLNSPASPGAPRLMTIGDGGAVLFNNNQVTYDWVVQQLANPVMRAPVAYFPVTLLTLDHLGVEGNQFAFRLRGLTPQARFTSPVLGFSEPVLAHALMVGGTLQVGGNRFAENLRSTILSLLAVGQLMNLSTFNQSTHQILVTTGLDLQLDQAGVDSPGADVFSQASPTVGELTVDRIGHQVIFSSNNINAGMESLRNVSLRFLALLNDPR